MANLILTPHTPTGGLSAPAITQVAGAQITLSPAAQRSRAVTEHPGSTQPDIPAGTAYRFSASWAKPLASPAFMRCPPSATPAATFGGCSGAAPTRRGRCGRRLPTCPSIRTALGILVGAHPAYDALDIVADGLVDLLEDDIGDVDHDRTADREQVGLEYQIALSKPAFGNLICIPLIANAPGAPVAGVAGWQVKEPITDPPGDRG